jgi:hypothetical protein
MKKLIPFLLASLFLLPAVAEAQFGPIVPDVCKTCPCGFGGVLAIIQNIVNFIISLSILFATIIIAWAGGLYMLSATNPESRSQANKMLINAVVGICIVLSAWLIVDFVMKTLYGGQFGPWNSILSNGGGDSCIVAKETDPLFSGNIFSVPGRGTTPGSEPDPAADGTFLYDPGIAAQRGDASAPLIALMNCMAQRMPPNVGRVSSISDSRITNGTKTFQQCAASRVCSHTANSCHYGGSRCTGKSYAVDFGDEENKVVLRAAANACGASFVLDEGDHIHVSVGPANNCGCDQ